MEFLQPVRKATAAHVEPTLHLAANGTLVQQREESIGQREAAMHWIGEEIVLAVATGADRAPRGNRVDGVRGIGERIVGLK